MVQPESDHRRPEQPGQPLSPQPPAAPQTVELDRQAAELAAMRRVLSASRGTFSLSVATCNSPALRDYLIGRLSAESPGIQVLTLPADIDDVFDQVRAKSSSVDRTALFLVNLEASVPSNQTEHPVLRALNASREPWRTNFACPVVFWLPEFAATLLSLHARDFCAWCSHRFEFVSEDTALASTSFEQSPMIAGEAANLDADRKHFRIAELQRRLEEAGDPPAMEIAQHVTSWLTELSFLHFSLGELTQAEAKSLKALESNEKLGRLENVAVQYGNLGLILKLRGDLDEAERMQRKSLEINEKLDQFEGMAISYGNLGLIYQTRGNLDEAERMHRKALEINERLSLLYGTAINYGNLGLIHATRSELPEAERMFRKAMEIHEKSGQLEGVAITYNNLGLIRRLRGDLDEAEHMHRKGLEIDEKLGRLEGMASQYGNLGLIHRRRGELDQAESMLRKSLEIEKRLDHLEGVASGYGNLGLLHRARGELDEAEHMFRMALEIDEKLGRLEGMATQYANLGSVLRQRGDIADAREAWTRSHDLFQQVGISDKVENVKALLDNLPAEDT